MSAETFVLNHPDFFWLAREREKVRLARLTNQAPPWTHDNILAEYRFCNVHRRLDKVSEWLCSQVYDRLEGQPHIFLAAILARWINKLETLQAIQPALLGDPSFDIRMALKAIHKAGAPVFGSAYIIQSPTGKDKIDGILWAFEQIVQRWHEGYKIALETKSMEKVHEWLMQFPHMGPFMAYQVVCDLTYGWLLRDAVDKMDWTVAGPGAARGLGWLVHDDPAAFNYNGVKDQIVMRAWMYDLLKLSQEERRWPQAAGPWELATVQHWSCEYDKWRRGHAGERLKRRFQP